MDINMLQEDSCYVSLVSTTNSVYAIKLIRRFPTKKDLKLHQIVHKESGPPYSCSQCSELIRTQAICQQHAQKHIQFTYTCPICQETFQQKSAAGQHLTKHFVGEILQISDTEEEAELGMHHISSYSWYYYQLKTGSCLRSKVDN